MTQDKWSQLRQRLLKTVGQNNYTTWIEPLEFDELEEGVAVFHVPTNFMGNYVSQNFADLILHEFSLSGEPVQRLSFKVAANSPVRPARAPEREEEPFVELSNGVTELENPAPRSAGAAADKMETLQAAPLDPRFTFDSFVVGKPNELAHAAARRVAEGGPVTFNPLVLYGGVGLGKTHLMHAIAWELTARKPDLNVLYLSAEQFMYRFVQALRERRMMDFKHLFRSVDVLMVGDVQFIAGKGSTQEEFFHTFNALLEGNQQIILTSDRYPKEIEGVEDRLKSRFGWGLTIAIEPPELETRVAILMKKAQQSNINLPHEVAFFIAKKLRSNVRELEGALNRVIANANFTGRPISIDFVKEALRDLLALQDKLVTIDNIQRTVAEYYRIRVSDLLSKRRSRSIARPRQVAMALSKELTNHSLPEIGDAFGGRDHTTVLHACRKVKSLRDESHEIKEDYQNLIRTLSS